MNDSDELDELAQLLLTASIPFRGTGGQTVPYVLPVHEAMADAVLKSDWLRDRSAAVWDECLGDIEKYELNTYQARQGNPYRDGNK